MDPKQEMTMDELKGVVQDAIKESGLAAELEVAKKEIADLKSVKVEKSDDIKEDANFIEKLIKNQLDSKTIGSGSASFGYAIPTTLANAIAEKRDKIAKIRANAFVIQQAGNFDLPTEGTSVTAYWVTTEADADITESNPTLAKKSLVDNWLAARVRMPYSLLNAASISVRDYVARLAGRALRNAEETAFVAGSGTDRPEGIRTADITQVDQAAATFGYDDVVNLYYAVPEQYRMNGKWLVPTSGMKLLRKLKDSNGVPIFNPADSTIFGKQVLEVTDIAGNLGTSGNETEIYFGDLSEYWIKDGAQMTAENRTIPGRLQAEIIVYQAVDGVVVNTDAFRKLIGVK
jgi:HK97 family phage major capsid protein